MAAEKNPNTNENPIYQRLMKIITSLEDANRRAESDPVAKFRTSANEIFTPWLTFCDPLIEDAYAKWSVESYILISKRILVFFALIPIVTGAFTVYVTLSGNTVVQQKLWYIYFIVLPAIPIISFLLIQFTKLWQQPYYHPLVIPCTLWLLMAVSNLTADLATQMYEVSIGQTFFGGYFPNAYYISGVHGMMVISNIPILQRLILGTSLISIIIGRWWIGVPNPVGQGAMIGATIYVTSFLSSTMASIHREMIVRRNFYVMYRSTVAVRASTVQSTNLLEITVKPARVKQLSDSTRDDIVKSTGNAIVAENNSSKKMTLFYRLDKWWRHHVLIRSSDKIFEKRFISLTARRSYVLLSYSLPFFLASHCCTLLSVLIQHQIYEDYNICAYIRIGVSMAILFPICVLSLTVPFERLPKVLQNNMTGLVCLSITAVMLNTLSTYTFCQSPKTTFFSGEIISEYIILFLALGGTFGCPNRWMIWSFITCFILVFVYTVSFGMIFGSFFLILTVLSTPWMLIMNGQMELERRLNLKDS